MTISPETLADLSDKYGQQSSWAVWNSEDITDLSIVEKCRENLQCEVVMVGLNVSDDIEKTWQNYHGGRNDHKLMRTFNDTSYRGSYMTDLLKNRVEANSKRALQEMGEEALQNNFELFYDEMNMLRATKDTLFILFGGDVKELSLQGPIFQFNNIVCCPHFSYYGITTEKWIKQIRSILSTHSKKTKQIFDTISFELD